MTNKNKLMTMLLLILITILGLIGCGNTDDPFKEAITEKVTVQIKSRYPNSEEIAYGLEITKCETSVGEDFELENVMIYHVLVIILTRSITRDIEYYAIVEYEGKTVLTIDLEEIA